MTRARWFAIAFASATLIIALCHRASTSGLASQASDNRAALMNPKHELWNQPAPDRFKVKFETSKGSFVIEAHRAWASHGVDRFYHLARAQFFDDSRFYRVRAGFIVQFGIPGVPAIASLWQHQTMPDDPVRQTNTRGRVAYAMTGPDTRTTQLYINLSDNARLDKDGFAPIGEVIEGMEIVDRLYAEYGEGAGGGMRSGKQEPLFKGGNAYLDREFPKLDKLIRATVMAH